MGTTLKGVNLGYMGIDYELLVFPHPNHILHTEQQRDRKHTWYQCPVISYIIEHPEGRVLWETGVSENWAEEWLPGWQFLIDNSAITPEVCLEARLKALELGPDDFRYVIQGHLHCDHAGGLRLFQDAGAEVVVQDDEWKHASALHAPEDFFVPQDFVHLDGKPTVVSGDVEIMKDLWLVSLPGHTPGTQGLLVRLDHTGWVLLTSDALYTHESYGPPGTGSPIVWDAGEWSNSVEKLRKVAMAREAFIFPGHDETGIQQYRTTSQLKKIKFWPDYEYA